MFFPDDAWQVGLMPIPGRRPQRWRIEELLTAVTARRRAG
jgi:hypothetical protein